METDKIDTDNTRNSDEGVGAGGKRIKKRSATSSKKPVSTTKKFTPEDDEWAKDLPPDFTENHKDWYRLLSAAMKQGPFHVCWAVVIARCIQALYALRNVRVELSPQHLINNIRGKNDITGHIIKFEELSNFLKNNGLVLEEFCKFSGKIDESCSKACSNQTSDESFYKIKEFSMILQPNVKEEDVLKLVNQHPVIAVIDAYQSFYMHKSGIYKGPTKRKDKHLGLHAVLVIGFGTTQEGEHYWLIQNSWGAEWGENGIGKVLRKCSQKNGEPSLFVDVIHIMV